MKLNKALFLTQFLLTLNCYSDEKIIEITAGKWEPYIVPENMNKPGVIIEIVQSAFKEEKTEIVLKDEPWARVESDINKNKAFSCGYIKNIEREKLWNFSEKILDSTTILYSNNQKFVWTGKVEDFYNKEIGITRGYSYSEKWDKILANPNNNLSIQVSNSDEINMKKLANSRLDIIIIDKIVGFDLIEKILNEKERKKVFLFHNPFIFSTGLYCVCDKKNTECIKNITILNKGMSKLKKTIKYKNIIKKYGI